MPILIADQLVPPIDEGMKKFTFLLFQHAAKNGRFRMLSSPGPLPIPSVECYRATKLLLGAGLRRQLGPPTGEPILYIPFASTTLASFLRAWMLRWIQPGSNITLLSLQQRRHSRWVAPFLRAGRFRIITFSRAARDRYAAMGLHAIALFPGVDSDLFKPADAVMRLALRKTRGWLPDDKVVLHVGHVRASRNLEALAGLARSGHRVVVLGSSSTPVEPATAQRLEQVGIEIVSAYQPRVEEWYQAADVYVFPATDQTGAIEFPLSILEAMACNLPVVTTPFGGLTDALRESAGFRYFTTPDELVERVAGVLNGPGIHNRETIEKNFTWEQAFDRLLAEV